MHFYIMVNDIKPIITRLAFRSSKYWWSVPNMPGSSWKNRPVWSFSLDDNACEVEDFSDGGLLNPQLQLRWRLEEGTWEPYLTKGTQRMQLTKLNK